MAPKETAATFARCERQRASPANGDFHRRWNHPPPHVTGVREQHTRSLPKSMLERTASCGRKTLSLRRGLPTQAQPQPHQRHHKRSIKGCEERPPRAERSFPQDAGRRPERAPASENPEGAKRLRGRVNKVKGFLTIVDGEGVSFLTWLQVGCLLGTFLLWVVEMWVSTYTLLLLFFFRG